MRSLWWRVSVIMLFGLALALAGVHFGLWRLQVALPVWLAVYLAREAWVLCYNLWGWLFSGRPDERKQTHKKAVLWFGIEIAAFVSAALFLWPSSGAY